STPTAGSSSRARVLFQELHGIADGLDLLGSITGDLAAELLFEGHHQLDRVEAVCPQVVDETGAVCNLSCSDTEMFHLDPLHARCDVADCSVPGRFADPRCCRVPKLGWGQAHARNCTMARADSRPDSRHS